MTDLAIRTLTRPLTLCVHEVDRDPGGDTLGLSRVDQLFLMLDELSMATLKRVDADDEAQFFVEVVPTPDPAVTRLLLRESVVVMTSEQIEVTATSDQWKAIAKRFATSIDTAAECYARA